MLICWLDQVTKQDLALVGGKGANLGEMFRAGFPVPRAFAVTAEAYRRQAAVGLDAPVLPEVAAAVREAYRQLGGRVAVRSSATAEDLPEASFAGQQESFLGVHGEAAVLQAVRDCWASLWAPRAVHYREQQGFDHQAVALSVVVQEMVEAEAAGVMFTVNPVTGAAGELTITASWGLGEAVVSGMVTPDTYTVAKHGLRVVGREIARKTVMVVQTGQGSSVVDVPDVRQGAPALSDELVLALAREGLKIERHYGGPQDIEWAVAGGKVYILQSRPVTTLRQTAPLPQGGWVDLSRMPRFARRRFWPTFQDHFPDPLRPFDLYTSLAPALAGVRRVAAELGLTMPAEIAVPHESGLVRFRVPVPDLPGVLLKLPRAWWRVRRWTGFDPLREWLEVDQPALRAALGAVSGEPLQQVAQLSAIIEDLAYRRFRKYMAPAVTAQTRLNKLLRQAGALAQKQKLLQGLDYRTAVINRDLLALARIAPSALPERSYGARYLAVKGTPFGEAVDRFLAAHGCRSASGMEPMPSYPAWQDEPEHVLSLVAALMADPSALRDDEAEKAAEYRQVRDALARRLAGTDFDWAVDTTRGFWVAREATLYFFEECVARIRALALTLGARLDQPGDIFFLAPGEVERTDARRVARERRLVWNRMQSSLGAVDGRQTGGDVLKGAGASQGVAKGRVRVIRGPHEFHKLQPGDVLVCPSTNPSWTPLFAIAAAVVADAGGVLSHAAIVAREYGIPAVMAVVGATQALSDGEPVEVDGAAGTVRRLEDRP